MKNEKVLPTIEQMKQDNENYKLNLLRHFEGADINLIIEAILESKGLQLLKLSDIQNEIVFDFNKSIEPFQTVIAHPLRCSLYISGFKI